MKKNAFHHTMGLAAVAALLLPAQAGAVDVVGELPKLEDAKLETFMTEVYGKRPVERPETLSFAELYPTETFEREPVAGGRRKIDAIRKMMVCRYKGPYGEDSFRFTVFLPKTATAAKPAPAYVLICNRNAGWNIDPWRDCQTGFWPAEEIVDRGYAAIAFWNDEVAPDCYDRDLAFKAGVFRCFEDPSKPRPADAWGSLSAWAWGASRIMDWIETEPLLDAKHVAVVGHSRGGKTALLAGVTDKRFAMTVSNCSGCGGAKLNHTDIPGAERIGDFFGHLRSACYWYCGNFEKWIGRDAELPFDQHQWMSLIAPRLLFVMSASKDYSAGPAGEKLATDLARPAWGDRGDLDVAYHCHEGKHDLTSYDWNKFMDFTDAHGWRGEAVKMKLPAEHKVVLIADACPTNRHVIGCKTSSQVAVEAGFIPLVLPGVVPDDRLGEMLDRADALLLFGSIAGEVDARYQFERKLVRMAAERNLPTLGICNGHQQINEAFGGSMCRNAKNVTDPSEAIDHNWKKSTWTNDQFHAVDVKPGTLVANAFGAGRRRVNTSHMYSLEKVADGFDVTARSPDGVVEAIEHRTKPIVGVQFHPERMAVRDGDKAALTLVRDALNGVRYRPRPAYDLHTRALTPIAEKPAPAGGQMRFVDAGELKFAIVLDTKAEKDCKYASGKSIEPAAELLADHFERTAGKRPAVLDENDPEVARYDYVLAVGDGRFARAAGVNWANLPEQGYAVKSFAKGLVLCGYDSSLVKGWTRGPIDRHGPSTGTFYAAVDFVERFLGCRHYFPGENGSVYPKLDTLDVRPVWYEDAPEFETRSTRWHVACTFWTDKSVAKWSKYMGAGLKKRDTSFLRYWREGGTRPVLGSHCPEPVAFAQAHSNDLRNIFYTSSSGKFWYNPHQHIGNYYDVTNLKFADLLVESYKAYFDSNGKVNHGKLGNQADIDSVTFGVCDTYMSPTEMLDNPVVKELGLIRDADLKGLPSATKRNVYGRFFQYLGGRMKTELPDKKLWLLVYYDSAYAPTDPRWTLPDNVCINLCLYDMPQRTRLPTALADTRKRAEEWYVARKGRPAECVWLYTSLNDRFRRPIVPEFVGDVPRALGKLIGRHSMFFDYNASPGTADIWHYFWGPYVASRAMWNSRLDVTAALSEMWTLLYGPEAGAHMREFHRVLQKNYLENAMTTREAIPQYPVEVIDALERELKAAKACLRPGSVEMKRYELVADYWPDAFRTQRARAAYVKPVYTAKKFAGEAPDWSALDTAPLRDPLGMDESAQPVSVRFAWNEKGIYGRFESKLPPCAKDSNDVWHNDSIEFFIAPGANAEVEHQFAWDPTGKDFSLRHRILPVNQPPEQSWTAPGSFCRPKVAADGWTADFFVPFGPFESGVPKPGEDWALNFVFTGRSGDREIVRGTALTLGRHHNMNMFGRIRFE